MSHFIYLVSTVFWTYRNVLRLNVLLTGSGNGLMPIWQQDISSQWTLVFFVLFFLFFHLSSPGIQWVNVYWLHGFIPSQYSTLSDGKENPVSLKPPQIKMRAGTETTTGTSHDTPHDIHQKRTCTYTHTYIYIYTHTYPCICISTCTNAHIHTPTVDITQSTMQSAMPRRRYQDMHRTTAMHIPMSEITRRLRHWCGKEQCAIFANQMQL